MSTVTIPAKPAEPERSYEPGTDTKGGNADKPQRVYRWTGKAAA